MVWILVILWVVICLSIPVSAGALFRAFIKTPKPDLLALLVGTVLFFFSNMFMEQRGFGVAEMISLQTETIQKHCSETGTPPLTLIPILSASIFGFFFIMIQAFLAKLGIKLVDKNRNETPNQSTHSITASGGSE